MDMLKLCVELGGCLTGEHGVGIEKRDLMPHQFIAERSRAADARARGLRPGTGGSIPPRCSRWRGESRRDSGAGETS